MTTDYEDKLNTCEQEKLIVIIVVTVLFAVIACIITAIIAVYCIVKHQNEAHHGKGKDNEQSLTSNVNPSIEIGNISSTATNPLKMNTNGSIPTYVARNSNLCHSAANSSLMVDQSMIISESTHGRFTRIMTTHQHAQNPSLANDDPPFNNFNSLTINAGMIHSDLLLKEMIANRDKGPIGNVTPVPHIITKKNVSGNRNHISYSYISPNVQLHNNTAANASIDEHTRQSYIHQSYQTPIADETNKIAWSLMHPQQQMFENTDGISTITASPANSHTPIIPNPMRSSIMNVSAMENFLMNPSYDDIEGDNKFNEGHHQISKKYNNNYTNNNASTFECQQYPEVERVRSSSHHLSPSHHSPINSHFSTSTINLSRISPTEINFEAEIGRGSSALVYKGRWRDCEVAIKRFKAESVDAQKVKNFLAVLDKNRELYEHENVVLVYAYVYDQQNPFTFVTEYMSGGSVKNHIGRDRPSASSISVLQRIEIAVQAARGIQHLHKYKFLHRDIACRNLLMESVMNQYNNSYAFLANVAQKRAVVITNAETGEDIVLSVPRVVIADYGLSALLGEDAYTRFANIQALKWRAPEVIEAERYSVESDVYAFGITFWEIMTGQEPYADVNPIDVSVQVLVHDKRPQSFAFVPVTVQNLMKECWDKKIHKRPGFDAIVQRLEQFLISEYEVRKKEQQSVFK